MITAGSPAAEHGRSGGGARRESEGEKGYNRSPVFEIGNSLREARLRQGLDVAQVESGTKIRGKYIQALEAERFDLLPAETYVKGFLRTYAEYLGLDGQLYVDEFNSRFASEEEPLVPSTATPRRRPRRSESNWVVVALAGIVAIVVLFVVAWRSADRSPADPGIGRVESQAAAGAAKKTESASPTTTDKQASPLRRARIVLVAARGNCWVQVRAGSVNGRELYEGTVETGEAQRFAGKRIWMLLGAPENLDVTLNGRRVNNLPKGTSVVLVTARGVRTVSSA